MLKKIPPYAKNFFVVSLAIFFFWMLFMDTNDIISQSKLNHKLNSLEKEKEYYLEKIEEVKKDREQLFSDQEQLERFAREKYLMKKEKEDVYVIVEEN